MKLYIAARYTQKEEMKHVAMLLRGKGFIITSSWLEERHAANTTLDQVPTRELKKYAQQDVEDIKAADAVVLFSVDPLIPTCRGGRHVETGIAIALEKPIYVVGPVENIFHYLPNVVQFQDIATLLKHLEGGLN